MKVTVLQENLVSTLTTVSRAVDARNTMPILGCILIATDNGRLRFSSNNLEMGITCWMGAKIETDGAIAVPAATFTELVRQLPHPQIDLTLNDKTKTLTVRSGGSVNHIKCIDDKAFPPAPVLDTQTGRLNRVSSTHFPLRPCSIQALLKRRRST